MGRKKGSPNKRKRTPRIKMTAAIQREFLRKFREFKTNKNKAAIAIGADRDTITALERNDSVFRHQVKGIREEFLDDAQEKLVADATSADSKFGLTSRIFFLKCGRPTDFTEGTKVKHTGKVPGTSKITNTLIVFDGQTPEQIGDGMKQRFTTLIAQAMDKQPKRIENESIETTAVVVGEK